METQYTDNAGITHDVRILSSFRNEEVMFTIYQDGDHFCDLERDEDRWIEVYNGPSERATEYGRLIDELILYVDRKFQQTVYNRHNTL